MKKKTKSIFIFCLLLIVINSLSAQDTIPPVGGLFVGFGGELNAHTRKGLAIGGNLLFGLDLKSQLAAGIKTGFFDNLDTVTALEIQAFLRLYPSLLRWASGAGGLFVQYELGSVIFFEFDKAFPALLNGWTAGWRFNFPQQWFLEPSLRLGYPHIWGINVSAGYTFPINK